MPSNNGTPDCGSYPYSLSMYRSPRTILTLDVWGADMTFSDLFTSDFKGILRYCRNNIDAARTRAIACLATSFPSTEAYQSAIDAVCTTLAGATTVQALIESPQASWPTGLASRITDLYGLGLYINIQMIPDIAKPAIANYFSDNGDGFLTNSGSLTLRDYFILPRSAFSQAELDLLYKGRRLGVLICHEQVAVTENKSGYCWNGSACTATSTNKVCSGNTASSDPC